MDANALQAIMASCYAWWFREHGAGTAIAAAAASQPQQQRQQQHTPVHSAAAAVAAATATVAPYINSSYPWQHAVYTAAAAQETIAAGGSSNDIWTDHPALSALQQAQLPAGLSAKERDRIQQRLKYFRWDQQQQQLFRLMPDGGVRLVPPPRQRRDLVWQHHQQCGHFGVRRTAALLHNKYWWHGMVSDTANCIRQCEHCGRVRASFSSKQEQLQSIPISSQGFRWHVDLAGPFPASKRGSKYILLAVEAFSKYLVAVPLPSKEPEAVAFAFLHHVLSRFAAPGQVVTDNGVEFTEGAFAQLLLDCLIDHGTTSVQHPRANGQAEKAVDTVKQALRKMCLDKYRLDEWDTDVAWLCLGYNCSPHSSHSFTPYELMYARPPVVPPAVRSSVSQPLDFDDPAAAAADLLARKQLVQQRCPAAMANLRIAQHRDQRRYEVVRSGQNRPRIYRFMPGDYVYTQQHQRHTTLQPHARPAILRVSEIKPSGVLVLEGKCGRTAEIRAEHCAPCHLPNLDGEIDPLLAGVDASTCCEVCTFPHHEAQMLLCDICNAGYHTYCLKPALSSIPEGYWLCPECVEAGMTVAAAEQREQQRSELLAHEGRPNIYPSAAMRRRDVAAEQLHGRYIVRKFTDPSTGRIRRYWGRLQYRGPLARPVYFTAIYEDGDSQGLSVRQVRPLLQPAGQQPPAGVSIPDVPTEPVAAAAVASAAGDSMRQWLQQHVAAAASSSVTATAVPVSAADVQQLVNAVDFSRVETVVGSAGSRQQQLAQQLQPLISRPWQYSVPAHAAYALVLAPAPETLLDALVVAISQQPPILLCYAATAALPISIGQLLQQQRLLGRAAAIRGTEGLWIVMACGIQPLAAWLQPNYQHILH
jgi:transposase InsO family protein